MTLDANASGETQPPRKSNVPQWLPASLLVVSGVALVVPIVLLRKHKANALKQSFQSAPPRRVTGSETEALSPQLRPAFSTTAATVDSAPSRTLPRPEPSSNPELVEDVPADANFNVAFHSIKAFSIATLAVSAVFASSIWAVKSTLGVTSVPEFTNLMRKKLLEKMPGLSASLQREPDSDSELSSSLPLGEDNPRQPSKSWTWPEAEERLSTALEQGGVVSWAETLVEEMNAEQRSSRLTSASDSSSQPSSPGSQ